MTEKENKREKTKELFLAQAKLTPVAEIVCQKIGLPRSTYYFMRKNDPEFAKAADEALADGRLLMNDLAESQLLTAVKNGNLTAIIYWLKNNSKLYGEKLELSGKIEQIRRELTPEEKEMLKEAIVMSMPESDPAEKVIPEQHENS